MTLKLWTDLSAKAGGFGTILNNMTLKLNMRYPELNILFWYHSKQHDSKTSGLGYLSNKSFWYHSKQHDSKTSENYFFSMIPYSHHLSIARFQFRRSEFFLHVYYTKLSPSWRKNPPFFNGGFSLFSSCNSEPDFTILSFCWSLILRKRNFWCCNDLVTR